MTILYTVETIHHYSCSECGQWWSIADHSETVKYTRIVQKQQPDGKIICPNCGHSVKPMEWPKDE